MRPIFAVDQTPKVLLEPAGTDWTSQHITGTRILESRRTHFERMAQEVRGEAAARARKLQAFAAPSTAWQSGGTDGIPLTTLDGAGGLANDYVPNGPAAVYFTAGSPEAVRRTIFFLSQKGKLVRKSQDGATASTLDVGGSNGGGHTFSRTFVTLSPAAGRVYLLSDDGWFFVVETATTPMTVQGLNLGVSGNAGLAPVYDPYTSNHGDASDDVYVPLANGSIRRFRVVKNAAGPDTITPVSTHNAGGSLWGVLKAPPIVLGGEAYFGDESGNVIRYDADAGVVRSTVSLGYPVNAGVALNLDNSGGVSDLFVNVGARCAWITYDAAGAATSTNLSRPLYLDEGDTKDSGLLSNWTYAATTRKYWLPAKEALTINTDNTGVALPGPEAVSTSQYLTFARAGVKAGTTPVNINVGIKPSAIVVDRVAGTGHIWITSYDSNNVKKYDAAGTLLGTYATGVKPTSVAIDASGNAWVTSEDSGQIRKMSSTGAVIGNYNVGIKPSDVAIDASGNVWVANHDSNSVTKLSSTGALIGTYAVGTKPKSLAIDASGNVWVANYDSNNVRKLSSTGATLGTYAVGTKPTSVAIDASGNVWVTNYDSNNVMKLSSTGTLVGTYTVGTKPTAVAIDKDRGFVYVANEDSGNYTKLDLYGVNLGNTTTGTKPSAIEVDLLGKVWCTNYDSGNVSTAIQGSDGPVYGYIRWDLASTYLPSASRISGMKVWLKTQTAPSSHGPPPNLRPTSHLHTGNQYWTRGTGTATDMTPTNEPALVGLGGAAFSVATANTDGWGNFANGRQNWGTNTWYGLRVISPPTTLSADYAVAVVDDTTTDDLYVWSGGAYTEEPGNAPGSKRKFAPRFYIDPTQAGNPQGMVTANTVIYPNTGTTSLTPAGTTYFNSQVTPLLEVEAAGKALPSISLETPPIVDSFGTRKFVYVYSSNAVFCLDFSSATNWVDTAGGATKFVVTRLGDSANGTAYGPTFPPSTAAAANRYVNAVEHRTAPMLNFNGSALYVLDRYPGDANLSPGTYKYGLTKIAITSTGIRTDNLKAYDPTVGTNPGNFEEFSPGGASSTSARDAAAYLTMDFFSSSGGGDHVYFALPAGSANTGYVYQLNP